MELHGEERVPAEVEEVVVDAHLGDSEEALPELHELALHAVLGRHVGRP